MLNTVAIDMNKLFLFAAMHACMLNKKIYCISSWMLNTAVVDVYVVTVAIIVVIDVRKLLYLLVAVMHACMLNKIIYLFISCY